MEYLDFPTDPRFKGKRHVVNIVVQEYEYGGYTKITEKVFVQDNGFTNRPSVFSKFAYKRMVYNGNTRLAVMVSATYTIGYGKKISRGNEIGVQKGGESAIM